MPILEAATRGVLCKKVFLEISQSQLHVQSQHTATLDE